MPIDYVKQGLSVRPLERAEPKGASVPPPVRGLEQDVRQTANAHNSLASRFDREVLVALGQLRNLWNLFVRELNTGSITLGKLGPKLMWGTGVPVANPLDVDGNGARAIYIDMAGGAATTLYVWEGAAWVGK